jgi:hypothetical protein
MNKNYNHKPMELLTFQRMEQQNLQASTAEDIRGNAVIAEIQRHYFEASSEEPVEDNELVLFQLMAFTHYHFLFAVTCNMRCHLAEAYSSARSAIDAALIAAQIIFDRDSQEAYVARRHPFDKLIRNYRNAIKDGGNLPHHLVEPLVDLHQKINSFASHADVGAFVHRTKFITGESQRTLVVEYFQFAENEIEREIHNLSLLQLFVIVLDVFSDFLLKEKKTVDQNWVDSLHSLGRSIEDEIEHLRLQLKSP